MADKNINNNNGSAARKSIVYDYTMIHTMKRICIWQQDVNYSLELSAYLGTFIRHKC